MVNPINLLEYPQENELEALEDIDQTCYNTPGNTNSGKYIIKIPRFDSGTPEEWIIFVDIVQMALVGQNVTTGLTMYKCMERVLEGDSKAKFTQQTNIGGSRTFGSFTTVMVTITMYWPIKIRIDAFIGT